MGDRCAVASESRFLLFFSFAPPPGFMQEQRTARYSLTVHLSKQLLLSSSSTRTFVWRIFNNSVKSGLPCFLTNLSTYCKRGTFSLLFVLLPLLSLNFAVGLVSLTRIWLHLQHPSHHNPITPERWDFHPAGGKFIIQIRLKRDKESDQRTAGLLSAGLWAEESSITVNWHSLLYWISGSGRRLSPYGLSVHSRPPDLETL